MGRHVSADLEQALRSAVEGEVRFDPLTRRIYSTDASIYAIEPLGVVCPRSADDVMAVLSVAKTFAVPVLPRGAGTSLAGQTVGKAVVLPSIGLHHSKDAHAMAFELNALILIGIGLALGVSGTGLTLRRFLQV